MNEEENKNIESIETQLSINNNPETVVENSKENIEITKEENETKNAEVIGLLIYFISKILCCLPVLIDTNLPGAFGVYQEFIDRHFLIFHFIPFLIIISLSIEFKNNTLIKVLFIVELVIILLSVIFIILLIKSFIECMKGCPG